MLWLRQGRSLVFARGTDAALRFGLFLATARVLAPSDYAIYALLTAALAASQWAFALGGPRVGLYFHARGVRGPLYGWLYALAAGASAAVIGLAVFAPPLRRAFFAHVPPGLLLLGQRVARWVNIERPALRKLEQLDWSAVLDDLRVPPGNQPEALKGRRKGQHSIRINDQWCLSFVWTADGPKKVEIVDYH